MKARSLLLVVLVAAIPSMAAPAFAQTDAAVNAMRDHFGKGVKAYDAKDYSHALDEFHAAYQAKPSPAILRNIALTLEGLGRDAEALDTLEQFVDDSGPALKPEVRDAATSEMHDIATRVATVHLRVVPRGSAQAIDAAEVTVDREPVTPARVARGIHLAPGDHVLHAHADQVGDGELHKAFAHGESTETVELAPAMAKLHVIVKPAAADIRIDGATVQHGSWAGPLPAGKHTVIVSAPGYAPVESVLALEPDQSRDVTVSLSANGSDPEAGSTATAAGSATAPPTPESPPPIRLTPPKRRFIELGAGLQGETLHPAATIGGDGRSESFGGIGLYSAIGTELGRYFTIGAFGELLFGTKTYATATNSMWTANTSDAVIGPELRFRSAGRPIRFVAAFGPALDLRWAAANQPSGSGTVVTTTGGGLGLGVQGEVGVDAQIPPAYLHLGLVLLVHDVSSVKDSTGTRLFEEGATSQLGVRALVGLPF
jgi:hypothetical protein